MKMSVTNVTKRKSEIRKGPRKGLDRVTLMRLKAIKQLHVLRPVVLLHRLSPAGILRIQSRARLKALRARRYELATLFGRKRPPKLVPSGEKARSQRDGKNGQDLSKCSQSTSKPACTTPKRSQSTSKPACTTPKRSQSTSKPACTTLKISDARFETQPSSLTPSATPSSVQPEANASTSSPRLRLRVNGVSPFPTRARLPERLPGSSRRRVLDLFDSDSEDQDAWLVSSPATSTSNTAVRESTSGHVFQVLTVNSISYDKRRFEATTSLPSMPMLDLTENDRRRDTTSPFEFDDKNETIFPPTPPRSIGLEMESPSSPTVPAVVCHNGSIRVRSIAEINEMCTQKEVAVPPTISLPPEATPTVPRPLEATPSVPHPLEATPMMSLLPETTGALVSAQVEHLVAVGDALIELKELLDGSDTDAVAAVREQLFGLLRKGVAQSVLCNRAIMADLKLWGVLCDDVQTRTAQQDAAFPRAFVTALLMLSASTDTKEAVEECLGTFVSGVEPRTGRHHVIVHEKPLAGLPRFREISDALKRPVPDRLERPTREGLFTRNRSLNPLIRLPKSRALVAPSHPPCPPGHRGPIIGHSRPFLPINPIPVAPRFVRSQLRGPRIVNVPSLLGPRGTVPLPPVCDTPRAYVAPRAPGATSAGMVTCPVPVPPAMFLIDPVADATAAEAKLPTERGNVPRWVVGAAPGYPTQP